MQSDDNTFWDELGLSWRASLREPALISRRLERRLRLQGLILTGATVAGAAISALGLALAAWTLWIGWSHDIWNFLSRGVTLAILSLLAAMAALTLRLRRGLETGSLVEMLHVSIARTERLIRVADLGCFSVMILAVGGTIGYFLRSRFGRPPAVPLFEDLLVLVVGALALAWYRRTQAQALRRYRYLHQAFDQGLGGE